MSSLEWQDVSDSDLKPNRVPASGNPPVVSTSNPWFAATIGLLGLIIGYVVENFLR